MVIIKKKNVIKRKRDTKTKANGLTGHPAERCEICNKQATHLAKICNFEVLFCDRHYKEWITGRSISEMKQSQYMRKTSPTIKRKREEKIPYQIFYKKHPTFELDRKLTKHDVLQEITYKYLTTIFASDPEEVYIKMQGENWSPRGEAKPLIRSLGLRHTSMSVGDCILDTSTQKLYQCDDIGWVEVKK